MGVNKILIKVDGTQTDAIDFNSAISGLSVGSHSITVEAYDGASLLHSQTKNVTVAATNIAPTTVADSYTMNEDTTLTTTTANGVLSNDSDADGDTLTAYLVSTTSNGSLTLNSDGTFTYIPNANYFGADSFVYRAYDGTVYSSNRTVNITINDVAEPDTTAPTITTAKVENAEPNKLVVVFSEVVTITNTTGLTITGAATPTLSAPTGSGSNTITFTLSTALTNGQSVTLNVASSNTIKDAANNALAATTKAITNNVAASTGSYLFDTYSGGKFSLSFEKKKSSQTGTLITVRNSSNIELGIGFSGDVLDEAALLSHIGSGNGYITEFNGIDGLGNIIKFYQTAASNQPRIALNGVIEKKNGKPAMYVDGDNDFLMCDDINYWKFMHDGTKSYLTSVIALTHSSRGDFFGNLRSSNDNGFIYSSTDSAQSFRAYIGIGSGPIGYLNQTGVVTSSGEQTLFTNISDATNQVVANRSIININGSGDIKNNTDSSDAPDVNPVQKAVIGALNVTGALPVQGHIQEINVWSGDFITTRQEIEDKIKTTYSII